MICAGRTNSHPFPYHLIYAKWLRFILLILLNGSLRIKVVAFIAGADQVSGLHVAIPRRFSEFSV